MKKADGFFAVRIALALFLAVAGILWAAAQRPDKSVPAVAGPADLRDELRRVQMLAPPNEGEPAFYDAGTYAVVDGDDPDAEAFAEGLVPAVSGGGSWPVALFEDPVTRETVFLNADGEEIGRLSPDPGYDPGWIVEALCPEGAPAAAGYDPSRVVMTAVLVSGDASGTRPSPESGGAPGPEGSEPGTAAAPPPSGGTASGDAASRETLKTGPVAVALPSASGAAASRSVTNEDSVVSRTVRARIPDTVYVDRAAGKDSWTGFSARRDASDGPKRTLRAGLAAARGNKGGNRLVIRGGAYGESLDVRGLAVSVRAEGNVVLASASETAAAEAASDAGTSVNAATGTVASVAN